MESKQQEWDGVITEFQQGLWHQSHSTADREEENPKYTHKVLRNNSETSTTQLIEYTHMKTPPSKQKGTQQTSKTSSMPLNSTSITTRPLVFITGQPTMTNKETHWQWPSCLYCNTVFPRQHLTLRLQEKSIY